MYENEIKNRVEWIREMVNNSNSKGVIVSVSGGIDSAVVLALAKLAFPDETIGIFINIYSSKSAKRNYLRIINSLELKELVVDLNEPFDLLKKSIFEIEDKYSLSIDKYDEYLKFGKINIDRSYLNLKNIDLIFGNIKARLRMTTIYAHAQKENYLVLETSNLSEIIIGYFTKWGDGVGDIAPIADLYKSEVYELAKLLKIPKQIIDSSPSADLWENQTDEEELGFTYDQLEKFNKGVEISSKSKEKIVKIINKNKHKLEVIPKYERK